MTVSSTTRTNASDGEGSRIPDLEIPLTVLRLETTLDFAVHAFDEIGAMPDDHRARVIDDLVSVVPDAASAAARAGHGAWASMLVLTAADCSPAWAAYCSRWRRMTEAALEAIAAFEDVAGPSAEVATDAEDTVDAV